MNKKLLLAIIIILTAIAYLPGINGSLLNWDDTIYILNNNLIQGSVSFDSFKNLYNYDKNISLVLFSFLIQTKLTGTDPFFFHAFNIFLHIVNVILAYKLFSFVLKKESYVFFATLLFAIHPLKVESVVWIMQRKDLMFSMFLMLSVLTYISILKNEKWYKYLFLFAFSFLASISKVQSLIIAPLLILIQYYFSGKITMRGFQIAIIVFLLMITSLFSLPTYIIVVVIPFLLLINIEKIQKLFEKIIFNIFSHKNKSSIQNLLTKKLFIFIIFLVFGFFLAYISTKGLIILGKVFESKMINASVLNNYKFVVKTTIYGFYLFFLLLVLIQFYTKFSLLNEKFKLSFKELLYKIISWIFKHWMFVLIFMITLLVFVIICDKSINSIDVLLMPIHHRSELLFLLVLILIEIGYFLNMIKIKLRFWWKFCACVILLALSAVAFNYFVLSGQNNFMNVNVLDSLSMALYSFSYYVLRFIYTFDLTAMNVYPDKIVDAKYFYISIVFLLFIVVLTVKAILQGRKKKELLNNIIFGMGFFSVTIFPVLHFIPIEGRVIVADRYTYLPHLGLIILFVILGEEFLCPLLKKIHKNLKFVLPLIFAIMFFYQTFARSKVWNNDLVFWSDVIEKDEENHYAWFSRGLYYYEKGNYLLAKTDYDKAISLCDYDSEYFSNRGAVNIKLKRYDDAIHDLNKALSLNKENLIALKNRIILYLETGEIDLAYNDLTKLGNNYLRVFNSQDIRNEIIVLKTAKDSFAIKEISEPVLSDYYMKVGSNYVEINNFQLALKFFNLAVQYNNHNHVAILNRGNVYAMLKDFDNAKNDYYYLIRLNNTNCSVYLNLGNILHESGQVDSACYYWDISRLKGCNNAQIMMEKFCSSIDIKGF